MNKEIKEILEFLKPIENRICATLGSKKCELLLDYITNLQQENERIKAQVTLLEDNRLFLNKKIDQAIKSLKQECMALEEWHYDGYDPQLNIIIDLLEADK